MESLLIPKIRKQSLTLDVVYGNPTDDDFEAIDAKRAWVRGETLMRISPPRNNANAAENDDQSKIIQTTETTTERRRNRVKTLLFHAEKDLVEIDSIEIDGQKGRWRRIFVDEEEDTNFTTTTTNTTPKAAANAFFDDSIVERIKLMKQVEDESLMTMNTGGGGSIGSTGSAGAASLISSRFAAGASIVLVELESGEEIDFNSKGGEDDPDAAMEDAGDEDEEMNDNKTDNTKKKDEGREVEVLMRFRSGNFPAAAAAKDDGEGIVAIDVDNTGDDDNGGDGDHEQRAQRSFWSSSSSPSSKNTKKHVITDLSVACDGEFFKAPGTLEKPSCWFPCVDVHDCLTEFDFDISCAPHLVAIAPGQFEEAVWEPEVSDIDGQFRRRHTFRSVVPCVARDVCVVVGPFSAHRAYRDATIETVDPNALPVNPFARTKKQTTKITHQMQSKEGITMYIPKTSMATNATEEDSDVAFLEHYERLKFLGRGVYDCMESFESYLGNLYPAEHTRLVFLPNSLAPNNARGFSLANATVLFSKDVFIVDPTDGPRCVESRASLAEALANLWFGVLLLPRDVVSDSWLVEGLAGNLANAYVQKCCGTNEISYRRAKEAEEVAMYDDGKVLPPLCSQATRLWREGCTTGGKGQRFSNAKKVEAVANGKKNAQVSVAANAAGQVIKSVEPKEVLVSGDSLYPFPKTLDDVAVLGSHSPLSLSPRIERLLRLKSVAVVGLLERRMGREGLQKVCKYFANLQQKRTKESSKDENNKGGDKSDAAKNKDSKKDASNKKTAKESQNQEHAQRMEKLREALASNARWISSQHFLDHCRSAVNLGKGEIASFVERWVYGCGSPTFDVEYSIRKRKNKLEFVLKVIHSPATLAADEAASRVARNHRTSVTIRLQEDATASDHVVALTAGGATAAPGTVAPSEHEHFAEMPLQVKTKESRYEKKKFSAPVVESGTGADINNDLLTAKDNQVSWVRVDPDGEWLCNIRLPTEQVGLESMQALLLDKEMDVVAQSSAVRFLAERAKIGSQTACAALEKCLRSNKTTFCRVRAEAAMALGKSTGVKSKFLGLSALVSYYRRTQCDPNTGFPKPNDTRDVSETIVDEAVLLALGASVDDSNSMNGVISTPTTAFDCLVDRLSRNDNTGNPNSDVGLIVAALEALSISMPPDAKRRDLAMAQAVRYAHRDPVFIKSDRNVVARSCYRALANLARFAFDDENVQVEKRQKVIESALQCVDDAVGLNAENARGRRDRISTLFLDAVGVNDDAGNLHECLEVIGKEPNPFARVHLLWDTIDAVTNYSHQKSSLAANDASLGQTKETFDQYYEKMLVHYRAKKETLNLLKSCAYTDGAKCKVAANKLLRTLTVKIKESPRHEKIEEYQIDDVMRAIKKASLRATQHPEPLSRADLHKIDPAAALRMAEKQRKRAKKEEKRMRKMREAQEREAQRLKSEEDQIFGAGGEVLDIEPVGFPPPAPPPVAPASAPHAPVSAPPVHAAPAPAPMDVDAPPPKPKMKLSFKFGAKK